MFEPFVVRRVEPDVATIGLPILETLVARSVGTSFTVSKPNNITFSPEPPIVESGLLLYCKGLSACATAQYTDEGVVVLKGSTGRVQVVPSMIPMSAGKHRQRLIDAGTLKLDGQNYVFQKDVLFKSPSGASDVVLARSSNGWVEWKDASGRTLDSLKRRRLESVQPSDSASSL